MFLDMFLQKFFAFSIYRTASSWEQSTQCSVLVRRRVNGTPTEHERGATEHDGTKWYHQTEQMNDACVTEQSGLARY
jgi:hypothetical protein